MNKDKKEPNKTKEDLALATDSFVSFIEYLPYGTLLIQEDELYFNKEVESIIGYKNEDIKTIEDWFKTLHPNNWSEVAKQYNNYRDGIFGGNETTLKITTKKGEKKDVRFQSKLSEIGDVWLLYDVTELLEDKRLSEIEHEEHKFILESMNIGIWDWDIESDTLTWNDQMYNLYGIKSKSEEDSYEIFRDMWHPDDLDRIDNEVAHVLSNPGTEFNSTFRIISSNGTVKYIRGDAKTYRNESGIATRMVGLNWDITKEVAKEEKRKSLTEKYHLILRSKKIGVWDFDAKREILHWNNQMYKLFDVPMGSEDKRKGIEKSIHPEDKELVKKNREIISQREIEYNEFEFRIITPGGSVKYLKSITKVEKSDNGDVSRLYGIYLDKTVIKEQEIELIESKQKAIQANKYKSEFLANMSHEIRTPLNGIIGITDLVLKTDVSEVQKSYLLKSQKASESLLDIINGILDLSKIEAGKVELEEIEFELEEVITSVSNIMGYKAKEKGLELIFSVEQDVHTHLIGDPLRLGQIITNLCSNAVKFTKEGEIQVLFENISKDPSQLELQVSVSDSGIGIKEEHLEKLFNSFSQADTSTTREYGGTGLGLNISKELVELMEGKIWVESEYGVGSKFSFTFKPELNLKFKEENVTTNSLYKGKRILVCDDNENSRIILSEILTFLNFEVKTVDNGYDLLDELEKQDPGYFDLLILDWNMPELNGIDVAKKIQESDTGDIPVIIMISAQRRSKIIELASEVNIDAFLNKPVASSILFNTIANLMGNETDPDKLYLKKHTKKAVNTDIFRGKRILLAEDNEINQLVANELLSSEGFLVDIANNGKEAIEKATTNKYDVALMDLQMPIIDGYEATKVIRKSLNSTELPIIAMTADALTGVRNRCLKIGMNDFLTKPIDNDKLFSILHKWLVSNSKPKMNLSNKTSNKLDLKEGLEGIDLDFGLSVVGGNEKLYEKLLAKFNQQYQNFFKKFISNFENDNNVAKRDLHTLKGVSGNIGAKKLYDLSSKYLSELDNGFKPNQNNMNDFNLELEKVLNSTSVYITNKSNNNSLTKNPELFLEKMSELENLLIEHDSNSIKVLNEILNLTDHLIYEEEFKVIKKFVSDYEYEKGLIEVKKLNIQK